MTREFKTIICPTDFSDASFHALEYALQFARASNGTLVLAHILHDTMSEEFRPGGHAIPFEEVVKRVKQHLETVRTETLGGYDRCELVAVVGDPHHEIVQLAAQRKADLIVVSTYGRSGFTHLLIGSVAEKVIRHAPCPVFVVREGIA